MEEKADRKALRVLVADDNEAMRSVIIRLLSRKDDLHLVGDAASGEEAIERSLQLDPDVVVMDVSMPGMGGIEATRQLRARLPLCRVVGYSSHEGEDLMREAGAADFVQKGDPPERLLQAIRSPE